MSKSAPCRINESEALIFLCDFQPHIQSTKEDNMDINHNVRKRLKSSFFRNDIIFTGGDLREYLCFQNVVC